MNPSSDRPYLPPLDYEIVMLTIVISNALNLKRYQDEGLLANTDCTGVPLYSGTAPVYATITDHNKSLHAFVKRRTICS